MEISENIEEYLEALWILTVERKKALAKINEIAEALGISPPSAVEMLRKMEKLGLVEYEARAGVRLSEEGRKKAEKIIRQHRLAELLLTEILGLELSREIHEKACKLEHHISEDVARAVCIKLNHPRKCPHGKYIPKGDCCP